MSMEDYHKAQRQGLKETREAEARGEDPGLRVLPEGTEALAMRRESLGIVEIPVEQIDGTCNDLRRSAFSWISVGHHAFLEHDIGVQRAFSGGDDGVSGFGFLIEGKDFT